MSSCDTFFNRFRDEAFANAEMGPEERWLSLAAGAGMVGFGLSRLRLAPLIALGAGAYLVYRGATGQCPLRSRFAAPQQTSPRANETAWSSQPAEGPWEGQATPAAADAVDRAVDCVDEAAMESFPASDPPSYTGAAGTPSVRIE